MFRPKINPSGLCMCGCGQVTGIWGRNDFNRGRLKGNHKKYISGHKLPPSFKGRTRSDLDRHNKSIAAKKRVLAGSHNFYRGGISNYWTVIRNSYEYKAWHRKVLERDHFKCFFCGAKGGWSAKSHSRTILHVDHIKPKAIFKSLLLDIDNGRTLCYKCHLQTPTWGGRTTYAKRQFYS